MATLGQSTGTGFTFTVSSSWGDMAGGSFTMPAGGGIVNEIHAYVGNNGTSQNCRLYVWQDSAGKPGSWLVRGSSTFALGALGWQQQTSLSGNPGLYIPGGTVIWIGAYCAGSTEQVGANAASGGGTEIGNTSDGNWSDHGAAGLGQMGAYIVYTPGGVGKVWTGSAWTDGALVKVWNGSSWVQANPQVWNGSAWNTTT